MSSKSAIGSTLDVVQIVTTIALVIGLGLVVYELQQARKMANLDTVNQGIAMRSAQFTTSMGENPAEVWVKGCLEPENLTPTEMAVHWNDVTLLFLNAERVLLIGSTGFDELPNEYYANSYMARYLGFKVGMAEYELYRDTWPTAVRQIAERIVEADSVVDCASWFVPLYERTTLKSMKL